MSKKTAISIVLGLEAVVYLFLFVGLPAIEEAMCATCGFTEEYAAPLILYIVPGLIGLLMLLVIAQKKVKIQKKEAESE